MFLFPFYEFRKETQQKIGGKKATTVSVGDLWL